MAWVIANGQGGTEATPVNDELNEEVEAEYFCANCDEEVAKDALVELGDSHYCKDCADNLKHCTNCNNYSYISGFTTVHTDRYNNTQELCQDCFNNNGCNCESCGEDYLTDNCNGTNDGYVCGACYENHYFTCDSCENVFHNDRYEADGQCDNCYERNDDEDEEYEDEDTTSPHIRAYDADPFRYAGNANAIALNIKKNPALPFLGVELEVAVERNLSSVRNACAAIQPVIHEMGIIKHDGSIDYGFEVTSLPMLLDEHRAWDGWKKIINEIAPKHLVKRSVDRRCGIHVHINRGAFTQVSLTRFVAFIHSKYNEEFIKLIAERVSERYCDMAEKDPTIHVARPAEKYQAVNLAKDVTVEVRIFAAILDEAHFFKNIEFVQALYEYCLSLPVAKKHKLSWETENPKSNPALRNEAFIEWVVGENAEKFPSLVGFLKSNLLKPNKKVVVNKIALTI